jgi:opacity protein-like surface antigen
MRKPQTFFLVFLLINCWITGYSQKFSAGIFTGMNISDIHGNEPYGKWKFKPGPSEGIFFTYSFTKLFGIKTGLNYSVLNYEHTNYSMPYIDYYPASVNPTYLPMPFLPYSFNEIMDFSFLTVPLQACISIPSRPKINLSAGMFYSFLTGQSDNDYLPVPASNDFGFIYSAGISYPFSSVWAGSLNAGYMTGRREFGESGNYRHGSMDFTIGIAYNGFFKKRVENRTEPVSDSISGKVNIIYRGGVNLSWNSGEYFNDKYSSTTGPSLGFAINIRLAPKVSFQTGLSYERTGYSLKDSSSSFYRYTEKSYPDYSQVSYPYYYVDTKVSIDYIMIPALINFYIGKSDRFYLNTGPYMGVRLNARVTGEAYNHITSETSYAVTKTVVYDDLEAVIKDNDFGWIFGGGVNVPVSDKLVIDLGLQYRTGLTDVFDRSYNSDVNPVKTEESVIKNGVLTFLIGLRVPVFK